MSEKRPHDATELQQEDTAPPQTEKKESTETKNVGQMQASEDSDSGTAPKKEEIPDAQKWWIPEVHLISPQVVHTEETTSDPVRLHFGECLLRLIDCDDPTRLERMVSISQDEENNMYLTSMETPHTEEAKSEEPIEATEPKQPKPKKLKLDASSVSASSSSEPSVSASSESSASASKDVIMQDVSDQYDSLALGHPKYCPMFTLRNEIAQETSPERKDELIRRMDRICAKRSLKVAVCVVVERHDGKVLLTRRSQKLEIFPSAWVNPGGHVDEGETLKQAGIREMHEETGIPENLIDKIKPLCLWESVFPTQVQYGMPKAQHIITFYHVKLKDDDVVVKLQQSEVDMCAWLDKDLVNRVLQQRKQHFVIGGPNPSAKNVPGFILTESAELKKVDIDISQFIGIYPNVQGQGIGNAHRFALNKWCKL